MTLQHRTCQCMKYFTKIPLPLHIRAKHILSIFFFFLRWPIGAIPFRVSIFHFVFLFSIFRCHFHFIFHFPFSISIIDFSSPRSLALALSRVHALYIWPLHCVRVRREPWNGAISKFLNAHAQTCRDDRSSWSHKTRLCFLLHFIRLLFPEMN